MPVSFRKFQQTYSDALRLTNSLSNPNNPIGEEGMARFLGGGKVLHYQHKGKRETCIVSKIASRTITIIWGAKGSGKTRLAMKMMDEYPPEEQAIYDFGFLQGDVNRLITPAGKKVMVIDQFPFEAEFGVLLAKIVAGNDLKTPVEIEHMIACVQFESEGWEPSFVIGKQLGMHPVNHIRL